MNISEKLFLIMKVTIRCYRLDVAAGALLAMIFSLIADAESQLLLFLLVDYL